jgi:hypothetical protein
LAAIELACRADCGDSFGYKIDYVGGWLNNHPPLKQDAKQQTIVVCVVGAAVAADHQHQLLLGGGVHSLGHPSHHL